MLACQAYVQKQQESHGGQDCTHRVEPGLAIVAKPSSR